jgi:hypothetical protein
MTSSEQETVSLSDFQAIGTEYCERFPDNDDSWSHPAIMGLRQTVDLMKAAIERGTPLTEAEVDEKMGPLSWEW